jgi:hypothetical protein
MQTGTRDLPHVVLFGGQDAPPTAALTRRWTKALRASLPRHRLSVLAWPRPARDHAARRAQLQLVTIELLDSSAVQTAHRRQRRRSCLDGYAALLVKNSVAWLELRTGCDAGGVPRDLLSRQVYRYTRFSVDALYDRAAFGAELIALAGSALESQRVDLVVAHSFGGTLALRAAWQLWDAGDRRTRFHLITLGTASGPMVVNAPMWASVPRDARGRIIPPPNVTSWQHFFSLADALVAAPALPRRFAGVAMQAVDTGRFLARGHAHALSSYLATAEVSNAVRALLSERVHPREQLGA